MSCKPQYEENCPAETVALLGHRFTFPMTQQQADAKWKLDPHNPARSSVADSLEFMVFYNMLASEEKAGVVHEKLNHELLRQWNKNRPIYEIRILSRISGKKLFKEMNALSGNRLNQKGENVLEWNHFFRKNDCLSFGLKKLNHEDSYIYIFYGITDAAAKESMIYGSIYGP